MSICSSVKIHDLHGVEGPFPGTSHRQALWNLYQHSAVNVDITSYFLATLIPRQSFLTKREKHITVKYFKASVMSGLMLSVKFTFMYVYVCLQELERALDP